LGERRRDGGGIAAEGFGVFAMGEWVWVCDKGSGCGVVRVGLQNGGGAGSR